MTIALKMQQLKLVTMIHIKDLNFGIQVFQIHNQIIGVANLQSKHHKSYKIVDEIVAKNMFIYKLRCTELINQ